MLSSIHIKPVKPSSERHNKREQDLSYVRKDLSHENSSFSVATISETRKEIEKAYRETRGQKLPKTATPIREGVLLIDKHHTAQDLAFLAAKLEERFGIKAIQGYCHKDEGHYDKITKEWKPNYHAHMVFKWTDEKGISIKMDKDQMSEMQTIVAQELGLERGVKSTKIHIDAKTFKSKKLEEELKLMYKVENVLPEAIKVIKTSKGIQKEIEGLKESKNSLEKKVSELETKSELTRANLKYLENKTEAQRQELQKIEEEKKAKQQNRGFKL